MWRPANTGLQGTLVLSLSLDAQTPQTLLAGTNGDGVFRTVDGGDSWEASSHGLTSSVIHALAIAPSQSSTVYAASQGDGVFKSIDGGRNWTPSTIGMGNADVRALAAGTASTVYAGLENGDVHKTVDGGDLWANASIGLPGTPIRSLFIDIGNPNVIYAGTFGSGVYRSIDVGENWSQLGRDLSIPLVNALAQSADGLYAATEGGGVFRFNRNGSDWQTLRLGFDTIAFGITVDPSVPTTAYVGTAFGGAFKTLDGGRSWIAINRGLTDPWVLSFAVDPSDSEVVYCGTEIEGIFKSTDGGLVWSQLPASPSRGVRALAVTGPPINLIYAATQAGTVNSDEGGLYTSDDGGSSWELSLEFNARALVIDPTARDTVYVGTRTRPYKRTAASTEWHPIDLGLSSNLAVTALTLDASSTSTLYAGVAKGGEHIAFKSEDGGNNWIGLTGLPDTSINGLAVDQTNPMTVYAGFEGGVREPSFLFRSVNGGETWRPFDSGIEGVQVLAMSSTPGSSKIYAATDDGVFTFQETCLDDLDCVGDEEVCSDGNCVSLVPTATPSETMTAVPSTTPSPTIASVATATSTMTATLVATQTQTPSASNTPPSGGPTHTRTANSTATLTATAVQTPTRTSEPDVTATAESTATAPVPSSTVTPLSTPELAGDCDDNMRVTISELIKGVNIALDRAMDPDCLRAFDRDSDGEISISELIRAVRAALSTNERRPALMIS